MKSQEIETRWCQKKYTALSHHPHQREHISGKRSLLQRSQQLRSWDWKIFSVQCWMWRWFFTKVWVCLHPDPRELVYTGQHLCNNLMVYSWSSMVITFEDPRNVVFNKNNLPGCQTEPEGQCLAVARHHQSLRTLILGLFSKQHITSDLSLTEFLYFQE